jgi:hypothetical protein
LSLLTSTNVKKGKKGRKNARRREAEETKTPGVAKTRKRKRPTSRERRAFEEDLTEKRKENRTATGR